MHLITHQWTEADRTLLADLIRHRWTARQIAPLIGVTRNAVLGYVHRHEELARLMPKRPKPPPKLHPADKKWRPAKLKKDKDNKVLEEKVETPQEPLHVKPEPVGKMLLVPIGNLGPNQCRWPVARDDNVTGFHLFCGRATVIGEVYCREHRKLAHPPKKVEN